MNEKFGKLLLNLDLTPTQVKIYLSVLRLSLCTVLDISKDTKINRSQIYFDTSILLERGFLELAAKRKRKFLAVQPNKIKRIIEEKNEKLKNLESILGEATNFYEENKKKDTSDFEIRIFEGKIKLKDAFDFELETSRGQEVVSLVGDISFQYNFVSEKYWDNWNRKFLEMGGKGKMLINKEDGNYKKLKNSMGHGMALEVKGISNLLLRVNFDVWGEFALIATFDRQPKVVIIKNKVLADSFREIFRRLWQKAE